MSPDTFLTMFGLVTGVIGAIVAQLFNWVLAPSQKKVLEANAIESMTKNLGTIADTGREMLEDARQARALAEERLAKLTLDFETFKRDCDAKSERLEQLTKELAKRNGVGKRKRRGMRL